MKVTFKLSGIIFFFLILAGLSAEEKKDNQLKIENFGWTMDIRLLDQSSALKLKIPDDIYKKTYFENLSDIRIFDSSNNIVPHLIESEPSDKTVEEKKFPIPVFEVNISPDNKINDLSAYVKLNANGAVLQVNSFNSPDKIISYYLLDTSGQDKVSEINLEWNSSDSSAIHMVDLEGSNDLKVWYVIGKNNPIFKMNSNGHSLEQNTIANQNMPEYRYLRLSSSENKSHFKVSRVIGKFQEEKTHKPEKYLKMSGRKSKEDSQYLYDTEGHFPVTSFRFLNLPENSGFEFILYSRSGDKDNWKFLKKGLAYSFNMDGKKVNQDRFEISENNSRNWKLEITEDTIKNIPEIEFGWVPQNIVFFNSGNTPYKLAFGNSDVSSNSHSVNKMLDELKQNNGVKIYYGEAKAGNMVYVERGSDAVSVLNKNYPRKIILWIVLILAIGLMMYMARSLFNQIQKEKKGI